MATAGRPRARGRFAATRAAVRVVYRDPDHVAERLTLYAAEALGEPSREWAERVRRERPDAPPTQVAEELRAQSARVARIDGAIAGTPFLIALVPGYVAYLWQEARMSLRMAALYGRDPTSLRTAAEMLVLRGVRPSTDEAERALREVLATPLPPAPEGRRPVRTWFESVYRLLVFGGFLGPSEPGEPRQSRLRWAFTALIGAAVWVTTWVLPVTFMLAMSWSCESHARDLGRRTHGFYAPKEVDARAVAEKTRRSRDVRLAIRSLAFALSVAVPVAFVAYVDHVRNTVGVNWLGAIGALVAVSLVAATSVAAARR